MSKKGTIVFWNGAKGYGFIEPVNDKNRTFFHISEFHGSREKLREGEAVSYDSSKDKQDRLCAINVVPKGEKPSSNRSARKRGNNGGRGFSDTYGTLMLLIFFGALALSVFLSKIPLELGLFYLVMSVATFLIYAWDKRAAQRDGWRTGESSLHFLALIGGWPGALMAQKTLRHKSIKANFRLVFWITVIINLAAFMWLHTSAGATLLSNFISTF